jgi:hypothetical protein
MEDTLQYADHKKATVTLISETQVYRTELSTARWKWERGKENLPVGGQTFPPLGMGLWYNYCRVPDGLIVGKGVYSQWILLPGAAVDIIVGSVYVPHGNTKEREKAYTEIHGFIVKLRRRGIVIWGGDINARLGMNGDKVTQMDTRANRLLKFAAELGYAFVNSSDRLCTGEFTRSEVSGSGIVNTTIDYVLVPKVVMHSLVVGLDIDPKAGLDSDHRPLVLSVRWKRKLGGILATPRTPLHLKWRIFEADSHTWNQYENTLDGYMVHWVACAERVRFTCTTDEWRSEHMANVLERSFMAHLKKVAVQCIGQKLVGSSSKPWFDQELRSLKKKRDQAHRTMRVAYAGPAAGRCRKLEARTEYIRIRQEWKTMVKTKKRKSELDTFRRLEADQGKCKLYWRRVKKLFSSMQGHSFPRSAMDSKGNLVTGTKEVCRVFLEHIRQLGREPVLVPRRVEEKDNGKSEAPFDDNFALGVIRLLQKLLEDKDLMRDEPALDKDIENEEVFAAVREVKLNTKSGDGFPPELYFNGGLGLVMGLTYLFNFVWKGIVWPDKWSEAPVFHLFKNLGSKADPAKYRGLSLVAVITKIFEAIMNNRLRRWSNDKRVISDLQGGFRRGRETLDQMLILNEMVGDRDERKLATYLCFVDVRKAYDRVWRPGLWKKLFDMGVTGRTLRMLQAMFQRVRRSVIVDGWTTDHAEIEAGLPQGGVLSPYLYTVFVNGLHKALSDKGLGVMVCGKLVPLLLFADDIVFMAPTMEQLDDMLRVLEDYAKKWRFTMANDKCGVVCAGGARERAATRAHNWTIAGKPVKVVQEYKYLGAEVGKLGRSKWVSCVQRLMTSTIQRANVISWVGGRESGLRPRTYLQLWRSMGRSGLEYACELWEGEISKTTSDQMENIQVSFLRSVTKPGRAASRVALLCEMGERFLKFRRQRLRLLYWGRLQMADPNRLLSILVARRAVQVDLGAAEQSWCKGTKTLLASWGLSRYWRHPPTDMIKWKGVVSGAEDKQWRGVVKMEMCRLPSLQHYSRLGDWPVNEMQRYLDDRSNLKGTSLKLQLRLGSLPLMTRIASRVGWPTTHGKCLMCLSGAMEDTAHFLLHCPAYTAERKACSRILKLRTNEDGPDVFGNATEDTRVGWIMGKPSPRAIQCAKRAAKVAYATDSTLKNFIRACWRRRSHRLAFMELSYMDGQYQAVVTPRPSVAYKYNIPPTKHSRENGPWRNWLVHTPWIAWGQTKLTRRSRYFVVWNGRENGLFYKWDDCWQSIKFLPRPGFKGFMRLENAVQFLQRFC